MNAVLCCLRKSWAARPGKVSGYYLILMFLHGASRLSWCLLPKQNAAKVLTDYGEVVDGKFQINKKWEWLPTVVCNSCRTRLQKDNSEVYFAGLTRQPYTEMTPPRPMTRATYGVCLCSVCLVGREDAAARI